jgi:hypothetical protein
MNIFFLHHSPQIAALYHCDKHVVKMIVETAQLLATAHHQHGNGHNVTYKQTHVNHPSAIWARESILHYSYLVDLGKSLCKQYRLRYGKQHRCYSLFTGELADPPPAMKAMPCKWRMPPQCMPDECKDEDVVKAYRNYYRRKKNVMTMVWYRNEGSYSPEFMGVDHATV